MSFIWREHGSDVLEAHFNPRQAVDGALDLIAEYAAQSAATRARIGGEYDIRFGPAPKMTFDLHRADGDTGPLAIFIHGGFWRALDKSDHTFVVPAFNAAGITVANLNYDLCPTVTLDELVQQVREGFLHIARNAADLGGDPERIYVVGHSAGAHLAAMLAAEDWTGADLAGDVIKGIVPISGIFEPEVLLSISVNEDVRLDRETAIRNSFLDRPPRWNMPTIVGVGGAETEGWMQQSVDYVANCVDAGVDAELVVVENGNHFTVLQAAVDPDTLLCRTMLDMIRGA